MMQQSAKALSQADMLIIGGTSLAVYPMEILCSDVIGYFLEYDT